jgi:hypothetical protein
VHAEPGRDAAFGSEADGFGRASIVLVGEGTLAEVGSLLFELLGRQGVTAELSRVARFERSLLFDAPAEDARVRVFMVLGSNAARLYFRGPGGERFLLRKLGLPNGLDAVGKEALGQIVESSTLSLLRSSEAGVDRAQASAEVGRDTEPDRPGSALPTAARSDGPPPPRARDGELAPPPASGRRAPVAYALELGARYSMLHAGPEIGPLHGPGLELGLTRRAGIELSFRALGERRLERRLRARGLDLRLAVTSLRGSAGAGLIFGGSHAVSLAFGAGVDFLGVTPEPGNDPTLTPAPARTHLVPMLRTELRYALTWRALSLAAGVFADVSLYDTHYDIRENAGVTRAAAPWAVRPGALVSIGGRWPP